MPGLGVLEALHQGDYDTALERLTQKALFGRPKEAQEAWLLLAEVYSLYGEEGLERAHQALEEAMGLGGLEGSPLVQALLAELFALEGRPKEEVMALLKPTEDPRARYHQAQALFYLAQLEGEEGLVRRALALLTPKGLPGFLAWRALALKARIQEGLGDQREAALAYEEAARLALGLERLRLLLDAAAMWLEAGEAERALALLGEAEGGLRGTGTEEEATWRYLLARAHLLLGNPNRALEEVREALRLEALLQAPAYGTPLLEGQILLQLGRYQEAMGSYEEALRRAGPGERGYVLHEMGVAALDHGQYLEAEARLRALLREEGYPYQAQARADLAEALYRQGLIPEAEALAQEAVALGAVAPGELVLGHIAYDRMGLEEALEHYRRAAEAAEEGGRDWSLAMEMAVEVLAQLGYRHPEEMVARIRAVLPYVPPSDEWHPALLAYLAEAEARLRGEKRPN